MNLNKLKTYTIEQIIDSVQMNKLNKKDILQKIKKDSHFEDQQTLIQKLDFAYNRINEPLELSLKLFYLFAPFGIANVFSDQEDSNFQRFKEYRFTKKIKQYYIFSSIGFLMYILIGVVAGIYSRYYSS